ncbi:hypothetical protein M409DRAFT_28298 [Zasmidium cellare ATCC 36951]|uniref:Phosducin domain-containing protein n=1 Tax=Zasmidium cellare ATCC 36951 TaxID=1080233 RepID=A0A6A6C685_ZASCE|nr:uncharacterized protein M409DRAFT_28298 [Zasmidium cellare ATCC 36951]KAF2161259.1 hypothetical protein M409DRAFT_28298 [Zasmidium cellare ATCC 36951]
MSAAQEEFTELMRDKDRRTRHPDDDNGDDGRSFLNLSEDDEPTPSSSRYPDMDAPRPSMSSARSTIPMKRYGANTGPKGVISDAQDFRDSRRSQRMSMRNSPSLVANTQTLSLKDRAAPEKVEEEDEEDLEDDDFMQSWRQSRLKEMQNGPRESNMHRNGQQRRLFGGLTTVDGDGYLDAVDNSGSDTVVVVYIFDDYSQVSDLIERCIRTLASKHQDTRFVKLHYEDAQMEPAGVPAVIAYRGGDKFAGLVPVIDEIPDDAELSALTLETVMKRHQILV